MVALRGFFELLDGGVVVEGVEWVDGGGWDG